ncbi:hypothetical protein [Mesorhizobium sp. A623]
METGISLAVFTPREAERITGVSTVMQRDWRRHGYLPVSEGHMRFNVFGLAELLALRLLAERRIGPQQGKLVSDWLAAGITRFALQSRRAYDGDAAEIQKLPDDTNKAAMREALEKLAAQAAPGSTFSLSGAPISWLAGANRLSRMVLKMHNKPEGIGRALPARFFLWFSDDTHTWHESVDKCFEEEGCADGLLAGPIVVLDQHAIGEHLLKMAGRAFVYVEDVPDDDTEADE